MWFWFANVLIISISQHTVCINSVSSRLSCGIYILIWKNRSIFVNQWFWETDEKFLMFETNTWTSVKVSNILSHQTLLLSLFWFRTITTIEIFLIWTQLYEIYLTLIITLMEFLISFMFRQFITLCWIQKIIQWKNFSVLQKSENHQFFLIMINYSYLYLILQQQSARFLGPSRERSPTLPGSITGQCSSGNNNHLLHRPCASCTDSCEHSDTKFFTQSAIVTESCRR